MFKTLEEHYNTWKTTQQSRVGQQGSKQKRTDEEAKLTTRHYTAREQLDKEESSSEGGVTLVQLSYGFSTPYLSALISDF